MQSQTIFVYTVAESGYYTVAIVIIVQVAVMFTNIIIIVQRPTLE